MTSFDEVVDLMRYLRGPKGCAWDRERSIDDFKEYLREESDEALDAIEKKDYVNLSEELGDILWHIIFISQIAEEKGYFRINDVLEGLKKKMIRRHPHVFKNGKKLHTSAEVEKEYEKIKKHEKKRNLSDL